MRRITCSAILALLLGILPNAQYEQRTCKLAVGDTLVLFSDCVTEACRPDFGEDFGEERLAEMVCTLRDRPASAIV